MSQQPQIIVLVRDLMFAGRIRATAAEAGVCVQMLRDPAVLVNQAAPRLIVDLNLPGGIEAAEQWKKQTQGEVIGFVAHTDQAAIDRAHSAGVDRVLARSRFVELLPQLLTTKL